MPTYAFRCRECRRAVEVFAPIAEGPPAQLDRCRCGGGEFVRDFSTVALQRPMHEHFDISIGKMVSDGRQIDRELRRLSDEHGERLGMTVNYERVDRDASSAGVTEEGIAKTKKGWRQVDDGPGTARASRSAARAGGPEKADDAKTRSAHAAKVKV